MRSQRDALAALVSAGLQCAPGACLLAVDAGALASSLGAGSVRQASAPELMGMDERYDAALVGGLGEVEPLVLASMVARLVRPGGAVAFVLPTPRTGLRGATSSLLSMLRRQAPILLEELCEALLLAGLEDIQARELEDASGTSLVWGRVRPP